MSKIPSIARRSLLLTGTFEAELLVTLMLSRWNHPLATDEDFRQNLLESASDMLQASVQGEKLLEELEPQNVNLVAALCFAEAATLASDQSIIPSERLLRQEWIDQVRRFVPSCFCNPDLLF